MISFSDPIFVIYFLPVQLLLTFKRSLIWRHVVTVLFSIAGLVLFKLSFATQFFKAINGQTAITMNLKRSFAEFSAGIIPLLGSVTFILFLIIIFLSLFSIVLKGRPRIALFYIIFIIPTIELLMGFLLGPDTMRYFTGSLFLGALIGFSFVFKPISALAEKVNFKNTYLGILSFLAVVVIFGYQSYHHFFRLEKPPHISCIESYAKATKADYIIADYWHAKPLIFFNTEDLLVLQFNENMHPFVHEFDTRIYAEIEGKDSLVGLVISSNIHKDSINIYRNKTLKGMECYGDSIFVLNRSPMD